MKKQLSFYSGLLLILCLLIVFGIQVIGSLTMADFLNTGYSKLNRPFFTPPNEVFGPVWTILYLLIGISLWFIYKEPTKLKKQKALALFFSQLFCNAIWSWLFFGLQNLFLAMVDLAALNILLILTINEFYKIKKAAAFLLFPYLIWVFFALILNIGFLLLN